MRLKNEIRQAHPKECSKDLGNHQHQWPLDPLKKAASLLTPEHLIDIEAGGDGGIGMSPIDLPGDQ